jgi:sugar phosphate isomerase/epimerase
MQLGVFGKIYKRETVEEVFAAVASDGLTSVQFNMESVGLPSMPDWIDPETARRIREAASDSGITIMAVSGTFNMIHPDPHVRSTGLQRLEVLAESCGAIGSEIITFCTGTRDPENMWRRHPENDAADAWRDLIASMSVALDIAERHDLKLAFEPEPGNVVTTPERGRRLIEEMGSPRLGVVIDAANLADEGDEDRLPAVLEVAFELLSDRILFAHAKDRAHGGEVVPAGQGAVPWDRYIELLRKVNPEMALIMHGLDEADVPDAAAFLQSRMT